MTQTRGMGNIRQGYDPRMISAAGKEIDVNALKTYFNSQKAVLEKEINELNNKIKTVTGGDITQKTDLSDDLNMLEKLQYVNSLALSLLNSANLSGNPLKDAKEIENYKERIKNYNNEAGGVISELSEMERQFRNQVMSVPNADRKNYSAPAYSYPGYHQEPYYVDIDIRNKPEELAKIGKRVIELRKQKTALLKKYNLKEPIFEGNDFTFAFDCLNEIKTSGLKDEKLISSSKLDRFFTYIQKVWYKDSASQNMDIS